DALLGRQLEVCKQESDLLDAAALVHIVIVLQASGAPSHGAVLTVVGPVLGVHALTRPAMLSPSSRPHQLTSTNLPRASPSVGARGCVHYCPGSAPTEASEDSGREG